MAEPLPPDSPDMAVRAFIALWALALVLGCVDAFRSSDYIQFVVFFILGIAVAIFDIYWMRFREFAKASRDSSNISRQRCRARRLGGVPVDA